MGFQMSKFEFQTLLVFLTPPPFLGHCPKFSRFLIMTPPLSGNCLTILIWWGQGNSLTTCNAVQPSTPHGLQNSRWSPWQMGSEKGSILNGLGAPIKISFLTQALLIYEKSRQTTEERKNIMMIVMTKIMSTTLMPVDHLTATDCQACARGNIILDIYIQSESLRKQQRNKLELSSVKLSK